MARSKALGTATANKSPSPAADRADGGAARPVAAPRQAGEAAAATGAVVEPPLPAPVTTAERAGAGSSSGPRPAAGGTGAVYGEEALAAAAVADEELEPPADGVTRYIASRSGCGDSTTSLRSSITRK